jgi:hypothetical protein
MARCSRKLEGQWWGDGGAYFVSSDGPDNITVAPQGGLILAEDGKWLFANIESPGFTFAITGPWIQASNASTSATP